MTRWLPVAAVFALLIGTGVAYGLRSDRWSTSTELREVMTRLPQVPLQIGDWVGQDDSDPALTDRLKSHGVVHELITRIYKNKSTGDVVTVLLATGKAGPISTHTPQTCLGDGGAWDPTSEITKWNCDEPTASFSRRDFARSDPVPLRMTIYWSWHSRDGWVSVKDPRVEFGSYPALTKIYVTQDASPFLTSDKNNDPASRFLRDCLPTIDEALFGPAAAPTATAAAPAAAAA